MAAVQTMPNKLGNFLKFEFAPEQYWCRKVVDVTYAGLAKEEVGEVVVQTGGVGNYAAVDATVDATADDAVIIVDDEIANKIAEDKALGSPTGAVSVAVLYQGQAIIRKGGLSMAVTTDAADVYANLEAKNIKFADKFSTYNQGA